MRKGKSPSFTEYMSFLKNRNGGVKTFSYQRGPKKEDLSKEGQKRAPKTKEDLFKGGDPIQKGTQKWDPSNGDPNPKGTRAGS